MKTARRANEKPIHGIQRKVSSVEVNPWFESPAIRSTIRYGVASYSGRLRFARYAIAIHFRLTIMVVTRVIPHSEGGQTASRNSGGSCFGSIG
jgi:hypothetical protein